MERVMESASKKEKIKGYKKKWRINNPEKIKAYREKYNEKYKEIISAKNKVLYQNNREELCRKNKEWYDENKEKILARRKKQYKENKEKILARSKEQYIKHKDKKLARDKEYRKENKEKFRARWGKRRADKCNRTPKWLSKDDLWILENAYELAHIRSNMFGFDWHVDHIIPLKGTIISGLHVPNNIQVVPANWNLRKSNVVIERFFG
jgi:hypothetical protein